jgi:hypothetical protein
VWNPVEYSTLVAWLDYDAAQAAAIGEYDFGHRILFHNDQVYYDGEEVGASATFAQQAASLAADGAQASDDGKWLPLGIFGLIPERQKTPELVIQLAANKAGMIRGNLYTETAQKNLPVHGAVDKQHHRVAWTTADSSHLVMETGLYNLTEDESTAMVYRRGQPSQTYTLVRLKPTSADAPER